MLPDQPSLIARLSRWQPWKPFELDQISEAQGSHLKYQKTINWSGPAGKSKNYLDALRSTYNESSNETRDHINLYNISDFSYAQTLEPHRSDMLEVAVTIPD